MDDVTAFLVSMVGTQTMHNKCERWWVAV